MFSDLLRLHCGLEATTDRPRHTTDFGRTREAKDAAVSALRLLTEQPVHIAFTEEIAHSPLAHGAAISWGPSLPFRGQDAVVSDAERTQLLGLWSRLRSNPNRALVELALRRWDAGMERRADEDKLIDYWVALESLFTPDSTQEVRFRASLRIAAYLGATPEARRSIYADMHHSYDWRSAVVHGASDKRRAQLDKRGALVDVTGWTRSYLRQALLRIIEAHRPFRADRLEGGLLGDIGPGATQLPPSTCGAGTT